MTALVRIDSGPGEPGRAILGRQDLRLKPRARLADVMQKGEDRETGDGSCRQRQHTKLLEPGADNRDLYQGAKHGRYVHGMLLKTQTLEFSTTLPRLGPW